MNTATAAKNVRSAFLVALAYVCVAAMAYGGRAMAGGYGK
jgi:hypothetical protein